MIEILKRGSVTSLWFLTKLFGIDQIKEYINNQIISGRINPEDFDSALKYCLYVISVEINYSLITKDIDGVDIQEIINDLTDSNLFYYEDSYVHCSF